MTALAAKVVRQRGFFAATITALGVFVTILLQSFLTSVTQVVWAFQFAAGSGGSFIDATWAELVLVALGGALPFAIGVALSLWFVAPIAAELRPLHVITRAVLASGIGAVLAIIVLIVVGFFSSFAFSGGLMANFFTTANFDGSRALFAVSSGLQSGIRYFIDSTPLVVLAGLLLWWWLDKHPSRHAVSGMVDEV